MQGVGFRITAQRLARQQGLSGTVKNVPGGSVALVVEGEREDIESFLNTLKQRFDIRDIHKEYKEIDAPSCDDFIILHQ